MQSTAADPQARALTVGNSQARAPRAVLFGQVSIEPDEAQPERMLAALRDGRLEFARLQEFGGLDGGTSTVPA